MHSNSPTEHAVVEAVLYALKVGCLAPVPYPNAQTSPVEWARWAALQHLHETVAALERELFAQLLDTTEREWACEP